MTLVLGLNVIKLFAGVDVSEYTMSLALQIVVAGEIAKAAAVTDPETPAVNVWVAVGVGTTIAGFSFEVAQVNRTLRPNAKEPDCLGVVGNDLTMVIV